MKLHANWGHASVTQLRRRLADSGGGMSHLVNHVDAVLDKAPHFPIAASSRVSASNEKIQVDLLFLEDLIVARAMDGFSRYSSLRPVQSKNPQEIRDVFSAGWLETFGHPKCIQMDEGDFCAERILVLNVAPNHSFKAWVLISGRWGGGAGWHEASIIVSLKMTGSPIRERRRKYNGV